MYPEERQQAMARSVVARGRLSVTDLADEFEVTTETVRRDLSVLERAGLVRRVHGGAVPSSALTMLEEALGERDRVHSDEKQRIAHAALALLPEAGTVALDAGSTTARLAAAIPSQHQLSVFTHAVPIASRLAGLPHLDLHLLPGRVRPATQAAVGEDTVAALERLRVDVAFVGANGLTVRHGLSTPDLSEAATKRALVRCASRVVALVDSSKIGLESTARFAEISEVHVLVTDAGATPADRTALERAGVEVVVA